MVSTQTLGPHAKRTTQRPVPRWVQWAAMVAALSPLPSTLWRLPLIFGVSMGMEDAIMDSVMNDPLWVRATYMIGLGVLSDGAAYLTLGLVRHWGEVFPSWIPRLGGRRVPPSAAIIPAVLGGVVVTVLVAQILGTWASNIPEWNGWTVFMTACYVPLGLWGPLLLIVAAAYAWRRRPAG